MSSKTKSSSTSYIKMATAKEERNLTMTIMHALEAGRKLIMNCFPGKIVNALQASLYQMERCFMEQNQIYFPVYYS